jgi:fibronectin-binding autotransporter adhesin
MTRKLPGLRPVGRLPILALLLVAIATAPAKAQTIRDWIDPAGGNYDDIANWSALNVPNTISESARFNIVGTYDVVQSPFLLTTVSDLLVYNGDVTFIPTNLFQAHFTTDDDAHITGGDLTLAKLITSSVTLNVGVQLLVNSGSTLNVIEGSDVTAPNLDLGLGGGAGTMLVDGAGSSLTVTTQTRVGSNGSIGTLTLQNASTGNSLGGTVYIMSGSSQTGSTGRLNVLSGSTLDTGNINVGQSSSASAVQEGTLTVDGASSTLTMTGASTLTIGDDINPNVVSDVIVSNSAVMSTGTGGTLIQNSGHLLILSGTFNANSNVTVDGGRLTRGTVSSGFNLGGHTFTAKNNAQITFGGAYSIDQSTTFDIQSNADFHTTHPLNIGDAGGNGTLVVDGVGSSVIDGAPSVWGSSGNTADITFSNNATGNLVGTSLANDTTGGTTGIFNVESGADVSTGNLDVASSGGATTSGTITVDGAGSTLTQNGFSSDLTIGHATSGTATINVQNGGIFTTDNGTTTVNATGEINIGVVGAGEFNANGNVNVDGGTINRGSSSTGFDFANGLTLTASNDAQINFAGTYDINYGTTFDIQSGADFSTTDLDIGVTGDGTLVVDGAGSSVTIMTFGAATSVWGSADTTADVTFRNAATGDLGTLDLAVDEGPLFNGATGIFRVESGATVTTKSITVAPFAHSGTSGTITVDGVGSSLTQTGSSFLDVGSNFSNTATINVQNGGTFTTGTGLALIQATGTVNVNSAGTFNVLGNLSLLGTINLNGGTLSLPDESQLSGSTGTFNFTSGVLEMRNSVTLSQPILDASLGGSTIGVGRELRVLGVTTLTAGTSLDVGGGTLDTAGLVMSLGSTLGALVSSTVSTGTLLAAAGSTIDATGSMTLGDASAVNGFYSNGNLLVGGGSTLTLLDVNDAVLDSATLVTLGGASAGTLAAANGLSLDLGGNVTGFGTVDTPNDPFKPLINNGNISGNSGFEPITLTGYVKGVGTLNNVVITGTDAPGFSPASVYRGSVTYAGEMEIEIGGLTAGSFDIVNHSGTATLGGTLDLSLINGFTPGLGDTFQFLTATSLVGNFTSVIGSDLGGGLAFDVIYGSNDVTLEVISTLLAGDLNADGFVGIADLNIVLGVWNTNVTPGDLFAGDPSGDGFVGIADLNVVLGNWNNGTPPSEAANIPEPGTLILLCACCAAVLRRSV